VTTACTFTLHKVWQPVRPDFHRWDANTACTFTLRTRHGRRHVPLAFACLLCTHQMYCIRLLHGLGTPVPGRMECPATQGLVISQKCVHTPIRTLNGLSAVQNTSHSRGRGRGAGERSSLAPRDARQHAVRATALACELSHRMRRRAPCAMTLDGRGTRSGSPGGGQASSNASRVRSKEASRPGRTVAPPLTPLSALRLPVPRLRFV